MAEYRPGPLRSYARSTRAHNTMEINGQDQCEFWSGFRVGRRAYPIRGRWQPHPYGFFLEATHTGYDHLPGQPRHWRGFQSNPGELIIHDWLKGGPDARGIVRMHFHPSVVLQPSGERKFLAERDGKRLWILISEAGARIGESRYCPEFGVALERKTLEVEISGSADSIAWCLWW